MQAAPALCVALFAAATALATPCFAQSNPASDPDEASIADIITASHILANEGVLDSFGHISARSAKNPKIMFIPRAMPPALVSRADIVEVGIDECRPTATNAPRLNGERFIHCRIYLARNDVNSVIHSHDLSVIPFSIAGTPLQPVVAQAGFLPPKTPLFEVREAQGQAKTRGMLVINAILGDALVKKLGPHPVILMRGHGDTVVGKAVREATIRALYTNINAKAQIAGMSLNKNIVVMDDAELAFNATENFDADRPWQNYLTRLNKR